MRYLSLGGRARAAQPLDSGLFLRAATILGKALSSNRLDAEAMEEIDEGKRPGQIDLSKRTGTVDMMVLLG